MKEPLEKMYVWSSVTLGPL